MLTFSALTFRVREEGCMRERVYAYCPLSWFLFSTCPHDPLSAN
jgi:hypothetical protein